MTVEEYREQEGSTLEDWQKMWDDGQLDQSAEKVHPQLIQYHNLFLSAGNGNRVFVPMCGKTKDLLWLARKGAKVVGTEFAAYACQSFFKDNHVPFTVQDLDGMAGKVYRSTDNDLDISIFQCDHYLVTSAMIGYDFDSVWDRGSFNSVPIRDQHKYINHMKSLLTKSATVLLAVVEYEIIDDLDNKHNIPNAEQSVYLAFKSLAKVEKIVRSMTEWQGDDNQTMEIAEILFQINFN